MKSAALRGEVVMLAGDAKAGDVSGDGSGRVWHVVKIGASETRAAAPQQQGYGGGTTY